MKLSQRVKRAHEELERCHITVHRLYTAIHDKDNNFKNVLSRLQTGNLLIYGATDDFITMQQQVNDSLLTRLKLLTDSLNYLGNCSCGV